MNNILLIAVGALGSYVTKIYSFLFYEIRLDYIQASAVYNELKVMGNKGYVIKRKLPKKEHDAVQIEVSLRWYKKIPFLLYFFEQNLQAGWQPKEIVCSIYTPFFLREKLLTVIEELLKHKPAKQEARVKMYINYGYSYITTNVLTDQDKSSISLPSAVENTIDNIVSDFISGKRSKTGILLYGPSGNGKTSLVKSVALRHKIDIYVPMFRKDMNNSEIILMFHDIPTEEKVIVLFEDFDSVFDKRKPLFEECAFSFDAILNVIDGVYVNTRNMIFVMTTNNIEKIDKALKNRPSRFDVVLEIKNPEYEERLSILKAHNLNGLSERVAKITDGMSGAVVSEIAKHPLTEDRYEEQVRDIIASFTVDVHQEATTTAT